MPVCGTTKTTVKPANATKERQGKTRKGLDDRGPNGNDGEWKWEADVRVCGSTGKDGCAAIAVALSTYPPPIALPLHATDATKAFAYD